MIDNYDSFTYNLVDYIASAGAEVRTERNDAIEPDEADAWGPTHLVVSPGPGTPREAGVSQAMIERFAERLPVLGVCLGHQVIVEMYGGRVDRATLLMHGKPDQVSHDSSPLYAGLPSPFEAGRYHSLAAIEVPDAADRHGAHAGRRGDGRAASRAGCARRPVPPRVGADAAGPHADRELPADGGGRMIDVAIAALVERRDLLPEEAHAAMMQVMDGEATPAQIAGFLVGLRMKGETVGEITGCARAMRAHVTPARPQHQTLVDTAGTGGDGAHTFNISTSAALVAAAGGAYVAKHGNRAVSSRSGSADVLEALGVRIDLAPADVADCIDEVGFGFMFAQAHHPAMRHAGPVRRELGVRTVFNVLGPLTNPAGAQRQVVGVYAPELVEPIAQVLAALGTEHALVAHGAGGLDELTPTGENLVAEVRDGQVSVSTVDPREFGAGPGSPEDLGGGDASANAAIIRTVFDGETGPRRDAVILNAGAALYVAGLSETLEQGVYAARDAIDDGRATATLGRLVEFTSARAGAQA